ncbi:hypothetical protein HM1_1665 [Heliomicrobium modesticaldum Ice1]|uniref:Uncharacterized protein n=1 Tax=Heliobacterium modesticaldum (strain ATCC 51547 / Ice1) TaxID=498761 RepID=B0TE40_HELMI|nr:hypothetical protein HM1_1665 [Heliomicrobium modesticaldum Ice1]
MSVVHRSNLPFPIRRYRSCIGAHNSIIATESFFSCLRRIAGELQGRV